jgi:hypothetical protein
MKRAHVKELRVTQADAPGAEGFHNWDVSEIVQNRHSRGTMARMALAIFMFTGLRPSDAAIFGRQHVTEVHNKNTGNWEKWIRIKPGKTDKSKVRSQPVVVELPLTVKVMLRFTACLSDQFPQHVVIEI